MNAPEKLAIFACFALFISFFSASALAQVQPETDQLRFYRVYATIDEDGRSYVNLTLTFWGPEEEFSMKVIGRVENFRADSNAGPVECDVSVSGVSDMSCRMQLTEQKREVSISFETVDFVRELGNSVLYFNADLSPKINTTSATATIKLPRNHFLFGESTGSSILTYPERAFAHIYGENIMVTWEFLNVNEADEVVLGVLYEEAEPPIWLQLRMRHFILLGATMSAVLGFIVVRHLRKSDRLVLSVLDEHERKVMDIIANEGEIKQKRIVDLSNLSKAKVSRVVNSLAERGLVEMERRGRTNKIRISKKKMADVKKEFAE